MVHFPSPSPFSPASFSGGEVSVTVDPMLNPPLSHISSSGGSGSYAAVEKGDPFRHGDAYENQLYMQQPPSTYPHLDIDDLELGDIFLSHADVDAGAVTSSGFMAPLECLEEELPMKSNILPYGQITQGHRMREHSGSFISAVNPMHQSQRPRLQHSLSMRIVSSQRPTRGARSGMRSSQREVLRVSKPVFPIDSVPLQEALRGRDRPSSATPSVSSTRSDPFDTLSSQHSVAAVSDPGSYSVKSTQSRDSGNGSTCSTPCGFYRSTGLIPGVFSSDMDPAPKHCMEVEMHMKYVRKIMEMDKRIIKLQAERCKLVEKVQHDSVKAESPTGKNQKWSQPPEKPQEIGRVHLYFVPVGIHPIDEPIFEEANSLLRTIGGMYFDLERAIATLREICCNGMLVAPDFSTCFAYMKSLINETQRLQLSKNNQGNYQIYVDLGGGSHLSAPQDFNDALAMANRVLLASQKITLSYHIMQMQLQQVQKMARDQVQACNSICEKIRLMDRDRRSQIKSIMEGNYATVTTAVRVWPLYYEAATETIKSITECIHPPSVM